VQTVVCTKALHCGVQTVVRTKALHCGVQRHTNTLHCGVQRHTEALHFIAQMHSVTTEENPHEDEANYQTTPKNLMNMTGYATLHT
jgi:hypothetical protein